MKKNNLNKYRLLTSIKFTCQWRNVALGTALFSCWGLHAQNPIVQTAYTADPAPLVYNDKLYLYTSHDEDDSTWFTMNDGPEEMRGLPSVLSAMESFICMCL